MAGDAGPRAASTMDATQKDAWRAVSDAADLRRLIREVPDFPRPGVLFRDITPLLADASGLAMAVELMAQPFRNAHVDLVVGAESRGFIFGTAVAKALSAGFVPVRKPGKLPCATRRCEYQLEYGVDALEMHTDVLRPGQRVLIVDDLLATGGTAAAAARLVERLGGKVSGLCFLVELTGLGGRKKLQGRDVFSLIQYDD